MNVQTVVALLGHGPGKTPSPFVTNIYGCLATPVQALVCRVTGLDSVRCRAVSCRCTLRSFQTAGGGLQDVSKDGRLAVDGLLQVFSVHSGQIIVSFSTHRHTGSHHTTTTTGHAADDCVQLVRLTADGKYVACRLIRIISSNAAGNFARRFPPQTFASSAP